MAGIIVNELVTKFSARYDRSFAQYDKMLARMDKQGQKMGANVARSFTSSFDRATSRIGNRMSQALRGISRQAGNLKIRPTVQIGGLSRAKGQIRELESAADKLNKRMGGLSLGGAIAGGLAAVGAGRAASFGFNAAKEYENSMMRLRTLMGDRGAQTSYKSLQKFAAVTPYELPEVVDMFTRLQGAGYGLADRKTGKIDFTKLMKLGDLASTSNKSLPELVDAILSSGRGLGSMVDNFIGLNAKAIGDGKLSASMTDIKTGAVKNYELDSSNKQQMLDFWLAAGARQGVAGGMGNLAMTLEGQMSTVTDTMKGIVAKAWLGMEKPVHKFLSTVIKGLEKLEPVAVRVGVHVGLALRKVPAIVKEIERWAPLAAAGIGLIGAKIIGLKYIAAAELLATISAEMKAVGVSTYFANGAFKGMLTGASLGGLVLLFTDFIQYLGTGDSMLLEFTKKWPKLHDNIKNAYDMNKLFIDALIIGLDKLKIKFDEFIKDLQDKNPLSVIQKLLDAPKVFGLSIGTDAGKALRDAYFPDSGSTPSTQSIASGRGIPMDKAIGLDDATASKMVRNARSIATIEGRCLNAVWKAHQKTLNNTSNMTATAAADAAKDLEKDKRFKEFKGKITPQMLNDPNYMRLFHGATAIYDRGAGFTAKTALYGHAEIWDMVNKSALFGRGNVSLKHRNQHNLDHVRLFIPVQNSNQQTVRMGGPGMGGAVTIQNQITVHAGSQAQGRDIARQTSKAASDGTSKALTKASNRFSRPTSE